ncbi:ATP-binding protein [Streptomyces sp. NPDC004082]|uniref:sensor histidine kinase n=1 Tax=unclassified Streptomyces TaxID=2593676 RepID=UPI0033B7B020
MSGNRDRRPQPRVTQRRSLRSSLGVPFVVPLVCLTGLGGFTAASLAQQQIQRQDDADQASFVAGSAESPTQPQDGHQPADEGRSTPTERERGGISAAAFENAQQMAPKAPQYGQLSLSARWASLTPRNEGVAGDHGAPLLAAAISRTTATDSVLGSSRALTAASLDSLAGADDDRAEELLLVALVSSGITLAVVVGAVVLARRARDARRSTLGRLSALQEGTQQWATHLPDLLNRIERGERIDLDALVPFGPQATDQDHIAQLSTHIDQLVRIAAQSTMRQSQGRQGTEKVVGQLIRRAQTLIHRLINLLDDLERKHEDSDLLKDIFKVDHLATRVRRHTENLMILSGATSGRRTTTPPTSITDVMRGAVAETEHYTRVHVVNTPDDRRVALAGRAVGDVTHLLAELIENGTQFSPPDTQVTVRAAKVARGLALQIEDQGLGIQPQQRDHANELLAHPPRIDMTALGEDPRLGHFVVAKLAERHRIRVVLRASDYGGTLALVLLPSELLEVVPSPVLDQLQSAAQATGRAVVSQPEASSPAVAGGRSSTDREALPSVGLSRGSSDEAITHSPAPDYSGFPEYGGAGLLPPAPGHHAGPVAAPAGWTAPARNAPPSRARHPEDSAERPVTSSTAAAAADVAGYDLPRRQRPPAQPGPPQERVVPGVMPADTLDDPEVLPKRVRRASLAPELRREPTLNDPGAGEVHDAFLDPQAAARTMAAIDAGIRRAGMSNESRNVRGWQDESAPPMPTNGEEPTQ